MWLSIYAHTPRTWKRTLGWQWTGKPSLPFRTPVRPFLCSPLMLRNSHMATKYRCWHVLAAPCTTGAGQIMTFWLTMELFSPLFSLSLSLCFDSVIFFSCKECLACLQSQEMLALWDWAGLGLLGSGTGDMKASASGGQSLSILFPLPWLKSFQKETPWSNQEGKVAGDIDSPRGWHEGQEMDRL